MIATNNWKEFVIGDIFPKRKISKHSSTPEEEGPIPFVSSSSMNNGVSSFCNEEPIQENCITVSTNGDCFDAFYQPIPVVLSNDVDVLFNDNLNKYNAMFICTILRLEKFKWDYGRKPKNGKVYKTVIKLPVKNQDDSEPDWDYMTEFIKRFGFIIFMITKTKMFKLTHKIGNSFLLQRFLILKLEEDSRKQLNRFNFVHAKIQTEFCMLLGQI